MSEVKKGLLIFPILRDLNQADGILVKNDGIRNGFMQNGVDVDVLEFSTKGAAINGKNIFSFHPNRYRRILQHRYSIWKKLPEFLRDKNYDLIWIRISIFNPSQAKFLEQLKKKTPSSKLIIEYGAYPFVNELTKLKQLIYYLNRGSEKRGHRIADFVITFSGQEKVDSIVNIPINNGIDLANISVVQHQPPTQERINFISVSSLKKWHAYERFIEGMRIYLDSANPHAISFHIVGSGPEYDKLFQLVRKLNLQNHVIFHQFKLGEELDRIYDQSHVAIGTLGFHRIGLHNSSSLKNREYFARGLPVVLATPDKDMPAALPFVKYIPGREEPVNVSDLVAFAIKLYLVPGLNQTIRNYAEENLSWKSKTKTVLEYLNKKKFQTTDIIEQKIYS